MSQTIASASDDTKYSIDIHEIPGNLSSVNDTDSFKNEHNYMTTLEDIDIKEEPLTTVDESCTRIEKETFTSPSQESLHVKVCHIVSTLFIYC